MWYLWDRDLSRINALWFPVWRQKSSWNTVSNSWRKIHRFRQSLILGRGVVSSRFLFCQKQGDLSQYLPLIWVRRRWIWLERMLQSLRGGTTKQSRNPVMDRRVTPFLAMTKLLFFKVIYFSLLFENFEILPQKKSSSLPISRMFVKWRSIHDWSMSHEWRFSEEYRLDLSSMNDFLINSSIGKRDRKKLISSSNSDSGREISRRQFLCHIIVRTLFLPICEVLSDLLIVFCR